ncbi:hypothetical protein [Marinibactrum halimedae]|uniref:Acetyltransferase n=1 Tax=Marinibactrum halimedae TaxID=1444977 RepID=A0AA37T6N5_9GAMM|nr:hypothetical protein [Marinibactrum halimedae]MCD9459655.1 hypothetical protein [Marinibactrum halimedae]GLS25682.1 hypothetical protein GCM10007877_13960 [Marinibactrum halimedae]
MLLKIKKTGLLVEVSDLLVLTDPRCSVVTAKTLRGYNEAKPTTLEKEELVFVSGESLPGCWFRFQAAHYRSEAERESA